MAGFTLNVRGVFPDGLVRAFVARTGPPGLAVTAQGKTVPPADASAVASQTVSNGTLIFDGLAPELHWAGATVNGVWRQVAFVAT